MEKLFSMHSKEGLPNGANEIESTTTGFIVSSEGQHKYPGKKTMIPNANGRITMSKVGYPVLGVDDLGNSVMMQPGGEYQFPGNDVYEIPMAQDGLFLRAGKFRPQTSTIGSTLGFKKVFPKKETTWTLTGDVGYGKNYNTDKEGLAASINAENFGKFFGGQRRFNAITNLEAFVEPGNYGGQFFAGPNFHWGTHPKRNLPRGTGRVDFQPFNMRVGYQSTPWEDDSGDALFQGTAGRMNYGLGTRLKGEYALPKKRALRGSKMNPVLFGDVGVDFDFLKSDYDEEGVARGSIHGTPTGFTINPSFSANVGIRVPIDGSRLRRKPKPSLVEDDVYYNPGIRVSDPEAVEAYEEPDDFQDGGTPKVKQRRGARKNPDNSVSTHLMMVEYVPERGWVAFPSLFQNSIPYADDSQNWVDMSDEEDWMKIYEEADARGEVYDFGEDKEAALAFGEGSWKDQLPDEGIEIELTDEEVEQYTTGGYVLEELQYGGEDDIIRPHGDPYEYKKIGDKYYSRRREGEYESEYDAGEEPSWNLATGQVRDDIRYKVFKEQRPTDSSKDDGEIHWRNKTGEPYKKDFYTAYLDGDIDQDKYSFIKWASNDIDNAINQTTDVSAKIALLKDKKRLDLQYDEIVNQGGVWKNDGTFSWPAIEKQKKELEQLEKPTWLDPIFDATNAVSVGSNYNVGQEVSDVVGDVTGNKTAGKFIGSATQEVADQVPWYLLSRLAGPVAIVAGVATTLDSAIESENPNYKRQIVDDVKDISRRTSQSYYPDWNNNQFTLDSRMRKDLNEVFGAGDAIQSAGRSIQKGWNNMSNTVEGWFNEDGGIVVDLNEDEALAYAKDGYIVEEIK